VAEGLREGVPEGQRRAAHASHAILLEASIPRSSSGTSNPVAARARAHLDAHFADHALSTETLARTLSVHRTTLFRAFQGTYGVSPSLYLHNRRMQNALALLHRSTMSVKEAAFRSGFSDPNYFSRAVKQTTGMTPTEFQNSSGS